MKIRSLKNELEVFRPTAGNPLHIGRRIPDERRIALVDLADDLTVGRFHATLWYENQSLWIKDDNSKNNTYVNGVPIRGKGNFRLSESDILEIGSYSLVLSDRYHPYQSGPALEMINVCKKKSGRMRVMDISMTIQRGDFVAIIGPSGCGKTTLLKLMCGVESREAGDGSTLRILGKEINDEWNRIKDRIGYVPQENIVHDHLTIIEELRYASRLRMDNPSKEECDFKILEVLGRLNIRNGQESETPSSQQIKTLSGGEKKRVCIGIELLKDNEILFLDEPTSPLDPGTIGYVMNCLADLNRQGTTIVMVTHRFEDIAYANKVAILGQGGYLAYFDRPDEQSIFRWFEVNNPGYPDDKKRVSDIYRKLSGDSRHWKEKFKQTPQYHNPSSGLRPNSNYIRRESQFAPLSSLFWERILNASYWNGYLRQLYWLTARCFSEKAKDQFFLLLMFVIPFIILLFVRVTNPVVNMQVLFWLAITGIFMGIFNAAGEILNERSIYQRERNINLKITSYLLSKFIVFSAFSLIQSLFSTGILFFLYNYLDPDEKIILVNFMQYFPFVAYVMIAASILGLAISALFSTLKQVMYAMLGILLFQILFSGIIAPIKDKPTELASYFFLGRWASEGLARIQSNDPRFLTTDTTYVVKPVVVSDQPARKNPRRRLPAVPPEPRQQLQRIMKESYKSLYSSAPVPKTDTFMLAKSTDTLFRIGFDVVSEGKSDTEKISGHRLVPWFRDSTKREPIDPVYKFNYSGNPKLMNCFGTLTKNLNAILILNILVFTILLIAMKMKDPR